MWNRRDLLATVAAMTLSAWTPTGLAKEPTGLAKEPTGLAFQATTDFSGRWTIEPPAAPTPPPAGSAAAAVRPDQGTLARGDMGSGWGSPLTITQDAKQLIVEAAVFSRYDANPQPRLTYALDGSESRNAVMIGHATQMRSSRAAWDGASLRITTSYPGVDPTSNKAFTTEVTHRLTLESPTMLIVEVTRAAALGGQAGTTRTVYRKG